MKKFTAYFIILIFAVIFSQSVALAAGPWKGQVIDIETKEPLEGAVVLAVWERVYRTPTGASSYFYEAKEVLTDKEGRFEIPSYTTINLLPLISYMRGPSFTIFKPGYGSFQMALGDYLTGEKKLVPYGGKLPLSGYMIRVSTGLIELQRLKTREERIKVLPGLPMYYDDMRKKVRNYIRLLNIEAIEIGLDPYPIEGGEVK